MGLERDMQNVSRQSINSSNEPADQDRSESTPLYGNVIDTGNLKLIIAFFFGFSITVTVALAIQISYGNVQIPRHGSVVSDDDRCSQIGAQILKQGGNAIDASIAIAFCMGVVNPHITGLGSAGFMLIYNQQERKLLDSIDFRATRYNHTSTAGVPGFVAGMALAHKLYGSMPWKDLLAPAERIAREGFWVAQTYRHSIESLPENSRLKRIMLRESVNEVSTNPHLASTLAFLGTSDPHEFYRNTSYLANDLWNVGDVSKITNYKALRGASTVGSFLHYRIVVPGAGSGGPYLVENLKMVNLSLTPLVSAVKAYNTTALNWPVSMASHIAVMDDNDVYVSLVSGLGSVLGSQVLTKSGYIMNDLAYINEDEADERPNTLVTPVIVLENKKVCGRRLLLGAGDVRDVAQALIYLLRYPSTDKLDIADAPRLRIRTPYLELEHENTSISDEDMFTLFHTMNFDLSAKESTPPLVYPSINVLQKIGDTLTAHSDIRGLGQYVIF